MKTFENIASLKLATLKEGQFVETGGYYSKGDGGGARYLIATPQAADEYGDHTLANGNVAVLQVNTSVTVKQFGAVGDGVANDSGAIAAAIDYADTSGRTKTVYAPNGTYIFSNALTLPTEVKLVGAGRDVTILKQINTSVHGLILNSFCEVHRLRIEAPSTNVDITTRGISFSDTTQVQVTDCRILYFGYGLFSGQEGGGLNWVNRFVNIRIDNPTNYGVYMSSINVHDDVLLESIYVRNDSLLGASIKTAYYVDGSLNTQFTNCIQDGGKTVGRYNIPWDIRNSRVFINGCRIEGAGAKANGVAGDEFDGLLRCIGSTVAINILQIHNCAPDPADTARGVWVYVDSQSQVTANGLVGNTNSFNDYDTHVGMTTDFGDNLCEINGSQRELILATAGSGAGKAQFKRTGVIKDVNTDSDTTPDINTVDTLRGLGSGTLTDLLNPHSHGQRVTIIWRTATATIENNARIVLQGGINFSPAINDRQTLEWDDIAQKWYEMSRATV